LYKQLKIVVGIMFAAILLYSGLWFTAAFEAEKSVAQMFTAWRDKGIQVEHGKIEHGGFPYRITVNVQNVEVATRSRGLTFKAESVLLVSHLWTPGHWIAEAHNTETTLAGGSTRFTDTFMHASYRLYDGGQAVVAVAPAALDDFELVSLMGRKMPQPSEWHLFLRFGGDSSSESSLYGKRFLDFKITSKAGNTAFEATGGISGPAITDWNKKILSNWRDEGGLLEFDTLDYAVEGGRSKGSASLTLDENFRLIGSASLVRSGNSRLSGLFDAFGLEPLGTTDGNGPASLMLQHGTVRLNGDPVAALAPVID
jgi:archaellum component FlaF (FlaF/FlaG flagellin family)